jgi:hypothetical protein
VHASGRVAGYLPGMPAPTHLPTRAPAPVVEPDAERDHRLDPSNGDGDHDRFAHYVSKRELERSRRRGTAVTALCGKRWKPDGDPSRYPMCPTCAEIAAERIASSFGS